MADAKQNTWEMEYAYFIADAQEFRKAHVTLNYEGDDHTRIAIAPEQMMTRAQLEELFAYMNNDVLKKLHIELVPDCSAALTFEGQTYAVELCADAPYVVAINPQ